MLVVDLTGQDGKTPRPAELRYLNGREMEDAREVEEERWGDPQDSQAALEVEKGNTNSVGLHQGFASRIEDPETGGRDEETGTGKEQDIGLGQVQIGGK